jgi:hypothetical protein
VNATVVCFAWQKIRLVEVEGCGDVLIVTCSVLYECAAVHRLRISKRLDISLSIDMAANTTETRDVDKKDVEIHDAERQNSVAVGDSSTAGGTARAQAMSLVFGKHGLKIVWGAMILMLIVYQFDNALMYSASATLIRPAVH